MYNSVEISNYLNGEMNGKQKQAFESLMCSDVFLKRKVDLMSSDLLLLNNYKKSHVTFDVDKAWLRVEKRTKQERKYSRFFLYAAAASIALIFVSIIFLQSNLVNNRIIHVKTLAKQEKEIILPDGSSVVMNNNSMISYPKNFTNSERKISFSGEAFFKIKKNKYKQFIVEMKNTQVKVLGTSFNIKARKDRIELFVQSGKVNFSYTTKDNKTLIVEKGDIAFASNNSITKELLREANYLSWRTKKMVFNKEKLSDIIPVIEKIYHVKIIMSDTLFNTRLWTSEFDNESLDIVLKSLCSSFDYHYSMKGDEILIKK